jgi:RHS repeat-associated protein
MTSCILVFNGERLDPVSETYHLGNGYRAYSPVLMRFTSPDSWSPFGAGGINSYAYCAGDPVNRADPSGHFSVGGALGAVIGFLGILFTPFTGGSSLAAALSVASVVTGTASVGLGIASELVSDPKTAAGLGWAGFALGILSGVGAAAASKLAPQASSLAGKLTGFTKGNRLANRSFAEAIELKIPEISPPKDLRLFDTENYHYSPSYSNRQELITEELESLEQALNSGKAKISIPGNLDELKEVVTHNNYQYHKFIFTNDNRIVVGTIYDYTSPEMRRVISHQALAIKSNAGESIKTAGEIRFHEKGFFEVTNRSGHYAPTKKSLKHMEEQLSLWQTVPRMLFVRQ